MRIRTLLTLILCATATASAQTTNPPANPRPLSLRECVDLALKHNLNLRIEHLTFDIAGDALSVASGPYDPNLTFGANHTYESALGDFDPRKFNPYFPSEISADTLAGDLSGKAPYGFSYDFGGSVRRNAAITDFRSDPGDAAMFPDGFRSTNSYDAAVGQNMRQHL